MSYNRIIMQGNTTREPELKYMADNTALCTFGIAVSEKFTKKDGSKGENTCFVECELWGKTAEIFAGSHDKGSPTLIEGQLKLDSWEKDGEKKSKHKIKVDRFFFIGAKKASGAPRDAVENQPNTIEGAPANTEAIITEEEISAADDAQNSVDMSDSLPF